MKDRLKQLRRELNLTQQEFADKIGIARGNIGSYEVGKNLPSDAVISLICKTFHVNKDWLRSGEGQMFMETPDSTLAKLKLEYNLDDFSYGLICEYLKLDERKRDVVRQYFHDVLSHDEGNATTLTETKINAMVEDYRQQLELEARVAEKSEALPESG